MPNQSLLSVLQSLRNQWVAMRDYEQTPLIELHKWSDIPTDLLLFNTISTEAQVLLFFGVQTFRFGRD